MISLETLYFPVGIKLYSREISKLDCGVNFEDDVADLEKRLKQLQAEVKSIKSDLSDEQLKLKRVSDLITAYETIVEGNYIDNLIKGHKERTKGIETRG